MLCDVNLQSSSSIKQSKTNATIVVDYVGAWPQPALNGLITGTNYNVLTTRVFTATVRHLQRLVKSMLLTHCSSVFQK